MDLVHWTKSTSDAILISTDWGRVMSKPVTILVAKTCFFELVRRAEAGEKIVIARRGEPVAKLVPVEQSPAVQRCPGRLKGLIALDDTFWDPLPSEEIGEDRPGPPDNVYVGI